MSNKRYFTSKRQGETHSFNINLAFHYSIEKAIILQDLLRFCTHKIDNKKLKKGLPLVYYSATALQEKYFYMKSKSIARWLKELEDDGILFSAVANNAKYDRTKSYLVNFEKYDLFSSSTISNLKWDKINDLEFKKYCENAIEQSEKTISQNEQWTTQNEQSISQNGQPIPNQTTNQTTNHFLRNLEISNNFNKFDNEQETEYIDFRPLAKEGKIGLLGKAKAICQDKLSYLTFDNFDNKKLSDILGSIRANLNAYNKQNNITARVTDESVLKAFKTALNSILNKSEETPSLAYVKSCLTPSLYLDNQSKETGKATSKPAGKDSGNNYSEYLKIVQAKFPHYQRLTPLDIKHLEQILSDIKGNGGTDIENFKELFENLPAWVLRSRVYQSVGFVASKINELNISLDEQIRSTEGFDFLVKKRGEAAAYELVKKVILKKKNASNS